MDVQHNSGLASSLSLFPPTVPICWSIGIDWHCNVAHHGKGPINGIGGTIKIEVLRQGKSSQIIINTTEDSCKAANKFCWSITTLFQKSDVILSEASDTEEAPGTLKIQKFRKCLPNGTGETQVNFLFLSNSKEPRWIQKYVTIKRRGHVDHDFGSRVQFRSTCAYCK